MESVFLIALVALVSSGALFLTLRWMGVIGTEVVAEVTEDQKSKPPA